METIASHPSEWHAPALRPVARWVPVTDEDGRRRVVMQWYVPDVDPALVTGAVATA